MSKKSKVFDTAEAEIVFVSENVICSSGVLGEGDPFEGVMGGADFNGGNAVG